MRSPTEILASARSLALDVEAFLLPTGCLGCGRPGAIFCDVCAHEMRPLAPPRCPRCFQTVDHWDGPSGPDVAQPALQGTAATRSCGFCRSWPEALVAATSAVWFEYPARELVHALKYSGWTAAAVPMAEAMARHIGADLRAADLLVPIPLGRRRRRERGHNQAEELALSLGDRIGVPVSTGALVRSRDTRTQTALHPAERLANVAGAFQVADRRTVKGRRIVLIDDVLTTGATLGAAALALAGAGAARVGAATFARAPKPE